MRTRDEQEETIYIGAIVYLAKPKRGTAARWPVGTAGRILEPVLATALFVVEDRSGVTRDVIVVERDDVTAARPDEENAG